MKLMGQIKREWPAGQPLPRLEILGREENLSSEQIQKWATEQKLIMGSDYDLSTSFVSELPQLMSEVSCGLILSQDSEIICRVAQEFLCCGCPILVSGVGSLEESLVDTSFGISLKALPQSEQVKVVKDFVWASSRESIAQRKERAAAAQQYFSWQKHSHDLESFTAKARSTP
jgi:glycosyltransferase involved in cell wall biosynthesis